MGIFDNMKEPVFLKETSDAELQLNKLKEIEPFLNAEGRKIINQDIRNLEYGIAGEKAIVYELKNSHMPMYILQDIYLNDGELSAQIDFIVITRKLRFIIECKNLYGNIEITSKGDFIRTMEYNGRKVKEGIYSPITQNKRHLELLKKIKMDGSGNIKKFIIDKYYETNFKSVVVLANNKTVLNDRYAKKEIKSQVIRLDQLNSYIKEMNNALDEFADSDKLLFENANRLLELNKSNPRDYMSKYEKYQIDTSVKPIVNEESINSKTDREVDLKAALKEYRLKKCREEGIKAYYIFNDKQLDDLIIKLPKSNEALLLVTGFGKVKVDKYGDDIISIIGKFVNE